REKIERILIGRSDAEEVLEVGHAGKTPNPTAKLQTKSNRPNPKSSPFGLGFLEFTRLAFGVYPLRHLVDLDEGDTGRSFESTYFRRVAAGLERDEQGGIEA